MTAVHYIGERVPVRLNTGKETYVEQHHAETTNINKIIGRYRRTGQMPVGKPPRYADVTIVREQLDVQLQLIEAMGLYDELPQEIRDNFRTAQDFLAYVDQQAQMEALAAAEEVPPEPITGTAPEETPPAE